MKAEKEHLAAKNVEKVQKYDEDMKILMEEIVGIKKEADRLSDLETVIKSDVQSMSVKKNKQYSKVKFLNEKKTEIQTKINSLNQKLGDFDTQIDSYSQTASQLAERRMSDRTVEDIANEIQQTESIISTQEQL